MPAPGKVLRDFGNRLVQLAQQSQRNATSGRNRSRSRLRGDRREARNHAIHASQKPADPCDPILLPIQIAIRRSRKQRIHPRSIRPISRHHIVRRNHIPPRLRHLRAVLDHHALRKLPRRRLIVGDHSQIPHHLGPEPRVNQMQNRVLHPANVLVDRKPVIRNSRRKWR